MLALLNWHLMLTFDAEKSNPQAEEEALLSMDQGGPKEGAQDGYEHAQAYLKLKAVVGLALAVLRFAAEDAPTVRIQFSFREALAQTGWNFTTMSIVVSILSSFLAVGMAGKDVFDLRHVSVKDAMSSKDGSVLRALRAAVPCESTEKLIDAGFSSQELRSRRDSTQAFTNRGHTTTQLARAGYTAQQLKQAGHTAKQLKEAGFTRRDLKEAGFTSRDLKEAGFTLRDLKEVGFTQHDLKEAGFTVRDLTKAGYFRGVLLDLPENFLNEGWIKHYDAPYAHRTTLENLQGVPSSAEYVFVGARGPSGRIALGAVGLRHIVLNRTTENNTREDNGVYWYLRDGRAFGFAPNASINLSSADITTSEESERLSWLVDVGHGGWRAGATKHLYEDSNWRKLLYYF